MKPFVKISVLVFVVAAESGIFLKNETQDNNLKQNGKQKLTSTTDTIIFSLKNIGLSNFGLNKTLHIKEDDDTPLRFYTDINYKAFLVGDHKNSNSFIGITYDHLYFHPENYTDSAFNALTDSCVFISDIQDTTILPPKSINDCIEDSLFFENKKEQLNNL